eukprot:343928-Hanusia_phi.AAC.1
MKTSRSETRGNEQGEEPVLFRVLAASPVSSLRRPPPLRHILFNASRPVQDRSGARLMSENLSALLDMVRPDTLPSTQPSREVKRPSPLRLGPRRTGSRQWLQGQLATRRARASKGQPREQGVANRLPETSKRRVQSQRVVWDGQEEQPRWGQ